MIEWIKFKGSTEEERKMEVIIPYMVLSGGYIPAIYTGHLYKFINCTHWAPLNLPQEEKWERKHKAEDFGLNRYFADEFDNIYSILNELRKR